MKSAFSINLLAMLLTSAITTTTVEEAKPDLSSRWRMAVEHLDGLGFPDPSGLPYHVIEVDSSEIYEQYRYRLSSGKLKRLTTRGWLLPEPSDKPAQRRRAITWNGHVYPVHQLGPKAFLEEDE